MVDVECGTIPSKGIPYLYVIVATVEDTGGGGGGGSGTGGS